MRSSGHRQDIFELRKGKEAKAASEAEKRGEWAMAAANGQSKNTATKNTSCFSAINK